MIPKVAGRGFSFKGVAAYLMNPTPEMQPGQSRVAWAESGNMAGLEIEHAWRVMAYTDLHAADLKAASDQSLSGAKPTAGAVYHYSLSWAIGEKPEPDHMRACVGETLDRLGLAEHQYLMVAHDDRAHAHVHVVANLTHPETGKRADPGLDKRTLQVWALGYEREHGMHCLAREANALAREQTGQGRKHQDQKQDYAREVTRAFHASDNGQSFRAALELEGLQLARSRRGKGFVIVDERGDIQRLPRQLDTVERDRAKSNAIADKLADLDRDRIPDGYALAKEIKERRRGADREQADGDRENRMLDAADRQAAKLARAQIAAERDAKRQDAYELRLSDVQERQQGEAKDLEQRLQQTAGPRLKEVTQEAGRLQSVIEARGFKSAVRRVFRGRQDRAQLAALREQAGRIEGGMKEARQALATVHTQERNDLAQRHERGRIRFHDLPTAEKIKILEKMAATPGKGIAKPDGPRRSLDGAERAKQERISRQIWRLREADGQAAEKKATERQMLADRVLSQERTIERRAQLPQRPAQPAREPEKGAGPFDRGRGAPKAPEPSRSPPRADDERRKEEQRQQPGTLSQAQQQAANQNAPEKAEDPRITKARADAEKIKQQWAQERGRDFGIEKD